MKYFCLFDTDVQKDVFVDNGIIELEKCGIKFVRVKEMPKKLNFNPNGEYQKGLRNGWNEYRRTLIEGKKEDEGGRWSE